MINKGSKIFSMKDASDIVRSGEMIGLGGGLSLRQPLALIRQIIRNGINNLHIVGNAHSIDVDMMCAAGAVGTAEVTHISFEFDFGQALHYRKACETGTIHAHESCCVTIVNQLRAAAFGYPFVALNSIRGTDILKLHPEYKVMPSPYDSREVIVAPPLKPDVVLIHGNCADESGNIHIDPPLTSDVILAKAGKRVIVSVEKLVSRDEMAQMGVTIPYFEVTAVVLAEFGAHPTSCYPDYAYDRSHLGLYQKMAAEGANVFNHDYLRPYVFEANHDEYLALIGRKHLTKLRQWGESPETWKELLSV